MASPHAERSWAAGRAVQHDVHMIAVAATPWLRPGLLNSNSTTNGVVPVLPPINSPNNSCSFLAASPECNRMWLSVHKHCELMSALGLAEHAGAWPDLYGLRAFARVSTLENHSAANCECGAQS